MPLPALLPPLLLPLDFDEVVVGGGALWTCEVVVGGAAGEGIVAGAAATVGVGTVLGATAAAVAVVVVALWARRC